jgi:murein DD-endopeptidase MepM/ murein hydrolase activator NlpD
MKYVLSIFVILVLAACGFVWFSGKTVELSVPKPVAAIGTETNITVNATGPNGVKSFTAAVEQDGQSQTVYSTRSKAKQRSQTFTFPVGKKEASFLKEGPAKLVFSAASNDPRGRRTTISKSVQVVLHPPTISADGYQHYINQGGAELVTLDLGGSWTEAGVRVGPYVSGTFPMPGQPDNSNHRFSLFAYPWDVNPDTNPIAFVRNAAGTDVTTTFWTKVFPKTFRQSNIPLNDRNLAKVDNELDPGGTGSLVDRFVKINREQRRKNAQTIYDLRTHTVNKMLWSGPFIPIKGARESYFADRRSYYYKGKKVDEQVHLGFDLAQTAHMSVTAANSGRVIYADRLGIYGNCVIIDHGYSLQTLYGHMSKIDVKVGDMVQKEQHIGVSGATGMAFGDHVHFSMLVQGIQVNPKEWWDEHWIHDRILSKLDPQAAAKMQDTAAPAESKSTPHHRRKHRR